jgi:pyruvate,water dikinase
LGLPAVVGSENSTDILKDGIVVTVSCAAGDTGVVYDSALDFQVERSSSTPSHGPSPR